jgi:hypothetical protein
MDDAYGLAIKDGARICIAEMYGDWYRDPWGWGEMLWVRDNPEKFPLNELIQKSREGISPLRVPEFNPIQVPKSQLGIRPAVVSSLDARILYASAIAASAAKLHTDLPSWVYGWRIRDGVRIARNSEEWREYVKAFSLPVSDEWVLKTDITSFFASTDAQQIDTLLIDKLGKSAPATIASAIVQSHDGLASHSGLPQRSFSSAVIANAWLRPIDDLIDRCLESKRISRAVRWMDDIYLFGRQDVLFGINVELHQRMRQLDLELNASKSGLIPVEELIKEFELELLDEIEIPHVAEPASGGRGEHSEYDPRKVLELEDHILNSPHAWSRHVVRLVLRALKEGGEFSRADEWLGILPTLPHHVDAIGRYMRAAAHEPGAPLDWDDLEHWFAEFASSPWSSLNWVKSQAALMFDSSRAASEPIKQCLTNWLEDSDDLQLVAIAVQRLGAIAPRLVRDVVRGRVDNTTSPLMLRNWALGLMGANEEKRLVKTVLSRDPRNIILTKMLEDQQYRSLPISGDFDFANDD